MDVPSASCLSRTIGNNSGGRHLTNPAPSLPSKSATAAERTLAAEEEESGEEVMKAKERKGETERVGGREEREERTTARREKGMFG